MILHLSSALADVTEVVNLLIEANKDNKPIPIISDRFPHIDENAAYKIQNKFVKQRLENDNIAGFKAGLTSNKSQKKFGLETPVAGVLLASGKNKGSPIIDIKNFKMPVIETEIGFIIGKTINKPIQEINMLVDKIGAVVPVIEIPDIGFEDTKRVKGVDIIASNVGATDFIIGDEKLFKEIDINEIIVTLYFNGNVVNRGIATDAMGNQLKALLWLVNTIVNQGWEIEPDQILITGVLGKMIPGKQGKYFANFGILGKISFNVK
ncbi:MAG: 2-keto-4-pentenoate hydratase [Thermodesulfobacteriota bacterium]